MDYQSAFSKVLSLMTRWRSAYPSRYDKVPEKRTFYLPDYYVINTYQEVRVFDMERKLVFIVFRLEDGSVDVWYGRNKDKYQHQIDTWLKRMNK